MTAVINYCVRLDFSKDQCLPLELGLQTGGEVSSLCQLLQYHRLLFIEF